MNAQHREKHKKAEAEALKEAEKEKAEVEKTKLQVQQRKNDQEYELQREKLRLEHERETNKTKEAEATSMAKAPELPVFRDNTDDIETYLEKFERIANAYKWDKSNWAIMLSSLLSGQALDVYGRLPISDATDYEKIKGALRKRYNLTEEGFRQKFRMSIPEESENPSEFATRIAIYLDKWMELADATDYDKLKTLFIKEQFLNACNLKLATYLKVQPFVGITEMCERSERYLQAHSEKLKNSNQRKSEGTKATEGSSNTNHGLSNTDQIPSNTEQRRSKDCYNCGKVGHIRAECRNEGGGNQQLCSKCNKFGHLAEICRNNGAFTGMMTTTKWVKRTKRLQSKTHNNTNARQDKEHQKTYSRQGLKPLKGIINGHIVDTLGDSGCTTICVNEKLVQTHQLTGQYQVCKMIDGTEKRFKTAEVDIDTPYIKQQRASVVCVKDLEFGIVIGNITGARCKCNPNIKWSPSKNKHFNQNFKGHNNRSHSQYAFDEDLTVR